MKKRIFKNKLISIFAAATMLISALPVTAADVQASDTPAISVTATKNNWDFGHAFTPAGSDYLAMQMSESQINGEEKPWVSYKIFAEEAGLYDIEFKSSPLANGGYTSPAAFLVNEAAVNTVLKESIDTNTKVYTALANLDAGENTIKFEITGPRPNTGKDGLFHVFYINAVKHEISTMRFEGEGTAAAGRDFTKTFYDGGSFKYTQTDAVAEIAAGNRWWKYNFNASAGKYTFTWRSTDIAGTKYVSPVKLTVNGKEVTAKTKKSDGDPWFIQSNEVELVDGVNEVKFLVTATKNFGAGTNALLYIDYIAFDYLGSNKYHGDLKFEGEDATGSKEVISNQDGYSANAWNRVRGTATTTFTSPADDFDLYITVGADIDVSQLTNGKYLGKAAISIDGGEFIELNGTNTTKIAGLTGSGSGISNSAKWQYNPGITLSEGEHTFAIKYNGVGSNGNTGNNFIYYDCFELVPKNAVLGEAVIEIPSSKVTEGTQMQAESDLYYTTGYLAEASKIMSVKYASSNPAVATVDADGYITALNPGVAEISVTYNDKYTDASNITVYDENGIVPISSSYNDETGKATIKLTKVTDSDVAPTVVFAAYNKNEKLSAVEIAGSVAPERGRITTVTKTVAGDVVKAFIWDSTEGMNPLVPTIALKSTEDIFSEYVDFTVEVAEGREPVILHITDTQIIDSAQKRSSGRLSADATEFWATDKMDERCFDYLREVVAETNPDLIILTGDIVYGEFDDNGTAFKAIIDVMESFDTPWAPVFGNHDNESELGADWQSARLEAAPNCLFKQRTLTGNGNYSVGITQGGELKRVFFMLDSNGGSSKSEKTMANGHSSKTTGFGQDQIDWYTAAAEKINTDFPGVKYSMAYHIHQYIFNHAYLKYNSYPVPVDVAAIQDEVENAPGTDFGYIGKKLDDGWNGDVSLYRSAKAFGCDSHFVGHEHAQSTSLTYDGTLFQFGQKSSTYDSLNWIDADGNVVNGSCKTDATPMVGGTVLKMNDDGSFGERYIHYCDGVTDAE